MPPMPPMPNMEADPGGCGDEPPVADAGADADEGEGWKHRVINVLLKGYLQYIILVNCNNIRGINIM